MNSHYSIITEGKYKGLRLYSERVSEADDIMPIELYFLFQHSFNNNYRVLHLHCKHNHNLVISKEELKKIISIVKNKIQIDNQTRVTFFSFDKKYINDYGTQNISNLYARFY